MFADLCSPGLPHRLRLYGIRGGPDDLPRHAGCCTSFALVPVTDAHPSPQVYGLQAIVFLLKRQWQFIVSWTR